MTKIRTATFKDLPRITEIYNWAIASTTSTFDTEPKTHADQQNWFEAHDETFCVLVAEDHDQIVGWASLNRWSDRLAYSGTAEVSLFVDNDWFGKGIGGELLSSLIKNALKGPLHTLLSRIALPGDVSIRLHEKHGFAKVGVMKEVGYKFDQFLDVALFQLVLEASADEGS